MARSPLTLAASVTSALPGAGVVGVSALTERTTGRYDTAVADLDDGRRVVVRAPTDPSAATELAAEARALRALTPGVRGLLPFRAPELLGETGIGGTRAIVVDFLPGYRVDASHLPPGPGAATSLGAALAAIHALPVSVVRAEGLPVRTPAQVRSDCVRVIDRAEATGRLPEGLARRWRLAVGSDPLWRFESAVVLSGVGAASFLFEDVEGVPTVTGLLEWHGLAAGDPACDLQWLASAPDAADDLFEAYIAHSERAPDVAARDRARLYAELEFAKWLLHGHDGDLPGVVDDAVELLTALAHGVAGEDIAASSVLGIDDAIALLDRTPGAAGPANTADTSMQTDAYDADELSRWIDDDPAGTPTITGADLGGDADDAETETDAAAPSGDAQATAPIDLGDYRLPRSAPADHARRAEPGPSSGVPDSPADDPLTPEQRAADDADRATEAALRRWLADG